MSGWNKIALSAIADKSNADEGANIANLPGVIRIYRAHDTFYEIVPFENALVLPSGSNDIAKYVNHILDTLKFDQ